MFYTNVVSTKKRYRCFPLSRVSNLPAETYTHLCLAEGSRFYSVVSAGTGTQALFPSAGAGCFSLGSGPELRANGERWDSIPGRIPGGAGELAGCPAGRREPRAEAAAAQAHRPGCATWGILALRGDRSVAAGGLGRAARAGERGEPGLPWVWGGDKPGSTASAPPAVTRGAQCAPRPRVGSDKGCEGRAGRFSPGEKVYPPHFGRRKLD